MVEKRACSVCGSLHPMEILTEFNGEYLKQFEAAGVVASGVNPETGLVEVIELENHPWYVATQYNPEYKSTVATPAPLFVAFVAAAMEYQKSCNAEKAVK